VNEEIESAYGHRTVTDAAVSAFGTLTGDYARLHFDHHFAAAMHRGSRVAHGLLSACWAIGALTRHAPAKMGVGDPEAVLAGGAVRFRRPVAVGDTLCVRVAGATPSETAFEVLRQDGEVVTSGEASVTRGALAPSPDAWPLEPWRPPPPDEPRYAEDLAADGPRGEGAGRTITESDVVRFASEVGETNPLYLNRVFAEGSRFGARIVPPMLGFCVGFADLLDALLRVPLPSTGFAGHLGDRWQLYRAAAIGDTVRGRFRTLTSRASKSHPAMAIVDFGLQLLDQRDRVLLQGSISMMIGRRPDRS